MADYKSNIVRDVDCINLAPIFKYLDEQKVDGSYICQQVGMTRKELTKYDNQISLKTGLAIFDMVKFLLKEQDPRILFYIGRESTRLGSLGFFIDLGRKLGTPEQAVRFSPRFNKKFNDIFDMAVFNVKKDSGILVVTYKDKPQYDGVWIYDQDHWNEGIFAGIPLGWNLPYMKTDPVLSRFTIEEVFKAYEYMGHNLERNENIYFANGKEIARQVVLETEELERSSDNIIKIGKKNDPEKIITNKIAAEFDTISEKDSANLPTGVIITKDFKIGNLWTLKEGMVFGAPYSRVNMKWEPKPKIREKVYDLFIGDRKYNKNLIQKLEEELEASKGKTYEIERLYKNLQIQTQHELKLEKNMAGGFAHEMRNALAGAQLEIKALVDYKQHGKSATEIIQKSATKIFKAIDTFHTKYGIPREEVGSEVVQYFKEMAETTEDLSKTIEHVQLDLVRGLSITSQIREYSKMSELKPGADTVDIVSLLKDYKRRYKQYFDESGITYGVDGIASAIIKSEETHIDSIFGNIILNAKDALSEDETADPKEITVTIKIDTNKKAEKMFVVEIKDNGPGIPQHLIDEIFEPFYSTKPTTGTGLGLGIVKKLVKLYSGQVDARSTVGLGTTFTITLPENTNE